MCYTYSYIWLKKYCWLIRTFEYIQIFSETWNQNLLLKFYQFLKKLEANINECKTKITLKNLIFFFFENLWKYFENNFKKIYFKNLSKNFV